MTGVAVAALVLAVSSAVACSIPGVFLVVRRQSMLADAISHAILPGIALAALWIRAIDSPLLIIGSALCGMLVVAATEYLEKTGLITGDAPQGLVFPSLFALGVIILSTSFSGVHIGIDTVLIGDLNIAALDELRIGAVNIGPPYAYILGVVAILDLLVVTLLFKELQVAAFDPAFASTLGIPVAALHYLLMLLVSITLTAAFYVTGAVLVLAFMIVPAATAVLFVRELGSVLVVSIAISVVVSVCGFFFTYWADLATSAGISVFFGVVFLGAFLVSTTRIAERWSAAA